MGFSDRHLGVGRYLSILQCITSHYRHLSKKRQSKCNKILSHLPRQFIASAINTCGKCDNYTYLFIYPKVIDVRDFVSDTFFFVSNTNKFVIVFT